MNKKLLNLSTRDAVLKLLFSTSVQAEPACNFSEKKLEYYRNLEASVKNMVNVEEWNKAKPFENIPGPKPLPVVGNTWRFFVPKIGDFHGLDFLDIHTKLHKEYGDVSILKGIMGHRPLVLLFNPQDIEKLHRHDGAWPLKRAFPSLRRYRQLRKDIIPHGGILTLDGEEWFKFRTLLNPILMQPQNITQYTGRVDAVAQELIQNMKQFSKQNTRGEMPENFEYELYKWSLESVAVVMMDTHFGVLDRNNHKNSEPAKFIDSVVEVFDLMYKLDVLPSIWRVFSTPNWRKFVKNFDFVLHTSLKHINARLDQLERGAVDETKEEINSVLFQLAKIDRGLAKTWSTEMMFVGVDTTAKVLAAALYFLAKNRDKQEKLRNEAFSLLESKDTTISKEIISKATYTKAVIKETTRLAPITAGNVRMTKTDVVLGGYQIPAGIHVQTSCLQLCKKDEHYPKAAEFLPERWLKTTTDEFSHKHTNPFVYSPFGYGPRSCIGKRLANLELEIALLKIFRNFELAWPHEDMVFKAYTLYGIARALKVHVKEI